MQKLNRFVTYIYSYRDSQRDTNVGFAKVDCRGGIVRLEIQIRKKIKETKEAQICLLAGTPAQPEAIPIGTMKFEKETGIYKGRFPVNELGGSAYTFEQVTGLYIKGEKELFASQWTQEDIQIAGVKVLHREGKPEKALEEKSPQEEQVRENEIPEEQFEERNFQGAAFQEERQEKPTLRATEAGPQYDWRYEWEKLDKSPGNELVFGLALWTRNKGKP